MIDVQRLRVLRAVAEHRSFNRAAAALHLTPSAVSQHVATLERSVGAPVVERSTRGVSLTEAGRIMVGAAEAVAVELASAARQVERVRTGRTQTTVATFTSGGRRLLPEPLRLASAAHPESVVHVVEAEPEESIRLLREGSVDLALAYHFDGPLPGEHGPASRTRWIPLLADPLVAVLPGSHPLAARESVDLAELATDGWVLGCRRTESYLRRYAEQAGFVPEVRGTTSDYFFARSLVVAGLGVSLIPSIALTPELPGLAVVPLRDPAPARHVGVVVRRRGTQPFVETLVEALRRQAS